MKHEGFRSGTTPGRIHTLSARLLQRVLPVLALLAAFASPVRADPIAFLGRGELLFSLQPVGVASAPQSVGIQNIGDDPLEITGVTLDGPHAGDFAITAGGGGATLEPGDFLTVSVTFTPTAEGERFAELTITSNDPDSPHTIPLFGEGALTGARPLVPTNAHMTIFEIIGDDFVPYDGDQATIAVGQCVAMSLVVTFQTGETRDVTGDPNTVFFTDPPRGEPVFFKNVFCPRPEDANKVFTIYAQYFSPSGQQAITDTVIVKVVRTLGPPAPPPPSDPNSRPVGANLFVLQIDGTPLAGTPDQVTIDVGQCIVLAMDVRLRSGEVLFVEGDPNTVFFTDPPRGSFPFKNVYCPAPQDANKTITVYGRYTGPTGERLTDTVIVKVRRSDGGS